MNTWIATARSHVTRLLLAGFALGGCAEGLPTQFTEETPRHAEPQAALTVPCTVSLAAQTVRCGNVAKDGTHSEIIGGQNTFVTLASSNAQYDAGTGIFEFDVTVQNLLNEAIGTPGAGIMDPNGIRVFFQKLPNVTSGTGTVSVANPDGFATFTAGNQPYFTWFEILPRAHVSASRRWRMNVSPEVRTFSFVVLIQTEIERLLVINELLANPGGTISDANGEWLELYNAGTLPVPLHGLMIADSAASGRRPYHMLDTDLVIQPGGYVVLGNTTNTILNGGVPVDYAYGSVMAFANSLDAFKISRVFGSDTLTIDRTQYASAAISAQNGISRELRNPSLDNANMDGSNWADAAETAVYGPGGRGTPGARNSTFVP